MAHKILESVDYTIDERSGKYCSGFPLDPSCEEFVNILINHSLPQLVTNPVIQLHCPIEIIDDISDGAVEDLSSSAGWSQIPSPNDIHVFVHKETLAPVATPSESMFDEFNNSSPVGVTSPTDTLQVNSSIVELADADEELNDPQF